MTHGGIALRVVNAHENHVENHCGIALRVVNGHEKLVFSRKNVLECVGKAWIYVSRFVALIGDP